jgi:WD40 repeat protein
MALTSDGTTLLVGEGNNASVRVWDVASGTETARYEVHFYPETNSRFSTDDIALSPDDTTLATLGSEGILSIWDAATGANLLRNTNHPDEVWSVAFSPDGSQLSTSYDLMIWRVWDTATYQPLHVEMGVFRIGYSDNKLSNVYSPDGSQIAVKSSFSIKVYNAATWTMIYEYDTSPTSVIYSADGSLLIVAGKDLRILEAATGNELVRLENHTHSINSVAMSSDGTLLATASNDGTVRLWGLP